MKRRNFIKITSSASVLSLLPTDVFALFKAAGMNTCPNVNAKKIVLIQLAGANDGINTIVPLNQYDKYATLRPNIKLSDTGTNKIINLDTTLSLANQVGLHPSLVGFKDLYDKGMMRVIQGVGYPIQDKSHFKSTDLWLTGGDGTPKNNAVESGWVGRFLENYYADFVNANFPLGIQLGSNENSLGFHGEVEHGMSLNINGQDAGGFYNVINGLGGQAPTNIPSSEYGDLLKFILANDTTANTFANTISSAFNSGSNSLTYPSTNSNTSLSNQLKTVARFISGGLQTKVYLVKIGGFDTHDMQVTSETSTHTGNHANLLTQVSEAVNAFITDLNNQNMGDDVVAVTFSEFGRKARENGNHGTDHGEIAPMFVFGKSIEAGISGTNVNLSEAVSTNNYQIQKVQHDYRSVFSTILQDWLGANNSTLDLTFYDNTKSTGFANAKVSNMIKAQSLVPTSCYKTKTLGIDEIEIQSEIIVYPNPSSEIISVNSQNIINNVAVFTMEGRSILYFANPTISNEFMFNVSSLPVGFYTLKVNTDNGNFVKKIIIRR